MSPLKLLRKATDEEASTVDFPHRHRGKRDRENLQDQIVVQVKELIENDGVVVLVHDGEWPGRDAHGTVVRIRRKLREDGIEIETADDFSGDETTTYLRKYKER